jgi:FtsP/CotA-like multicopper oxidase with cupredoxin domain
LLRKGHREAHSWSIMTWLSFYPSTVNGSFPGPPIYVDKGERVRLQVANELSSFEGLTMHVHGMYQRCVPTLLYHTCLVMCAGPSGTLNLRT